MDDNTSFASGNNSMNNSVPPRRKIFTSHFLELIGLLIVVGLVAWLGIQYWQAQQLTEEYVPVYTPRVVANADWKIYTNPQYGFEFKYPSDNSVSLDLSDPNQFVVLLNNTNDQGSDFFYVVPRGFTDPGRKSLFNTGVQTQTVQFAGVNAKEYAGTQNPFVDKVLNFSTYPASWTLKNEIGYQADQQVYVPILERILSTFKFTPAVDTSTWKTYTNAQYGFGFKYPDDWTLRNGKDQGVADIFNLVSVIKNFGEKYSMYVSFTSSKENLGQGLSGKTVSFAGADWIKVQDNDGVPGSANPHDDFAFFTSKNGLNYEIQIYPVTDVPNGKIINQDPILDQILSTFKFLP